MVLFAVVAAAIVVGIVVLSLLLRKPGAQLPPEADLG
jgi:hypothetical protein